MLANSFASTKPVIHPIVVAAGVGKRFGSVLPKQYTQIKGKTVLEHSVTALSQSSYLNQPTSLPCHLVISEHDNIAQSLNFALPVVWVTGGAERIDSVFSGVRAIFQKLMASYDIASYDIDGLAEPLAGHWVLIHDAARPCVLPADIDRLITLTTQHPIGQTAGGLLAVPARDTIKQISPPSKNDDLPTSQRTLERKQLWLAQTPQLFPLIALYYYLHQAIDKSIIFTDEASLFEHFGHTPLLVEGHHSNIKLTFPEDVFVAQAMLSKHDTK